MWHVKVSVQLSEEDGVRMGVAENAGLVHMLSGELKLCAENSEIGKLRSEVFICAEEAAPSSSGIHVPKEDSDGVEDRGEGRGLVEAWSSNSSCMQQFGKGSINRDVKAGPFIFKAGGMLGTAQLKTEEKGEPSASLTKSGVGPLVSSLSRAPCSHRLCSSFAKSVLSIRSGPDLTRSNQVNTGH